MRHLLCSRCTLLAWLAVLLGLLYLLPAAHADEAGPPWLGVGVEKGVRGVRIREVMPESPCAGAQIMAGDEVLSLDQAPVHQPQELIARVRSARLGQTVTLRLASPQGTERTVQVTLLPRPNLEELQRRTLEGHAAPDFSPQVLAGAALPALSGLRGQVVLLDFFASWCGPCMQLLPTIDRLHERYRRRGLRVVGVSAESQAAIEGVLREHRPHYTVAMDTGEKATQAYLIQRLPTLVVVDRRGTVRAVLGNDVDEAVRQIESALGETGKPPG